jgi:outer membrane protein assembly factor BamB
MENRRRVCTLLVVGVGLLGLTTLLMNEPAAGQVKAKKFQPVAQPAPIQIQPGIPGQPGIVGQPKPKPRDDAWPQSSAIQLIEKSEYRQYISVAKECIRDKDWNDAVEALQTIMENKEDFYVRVEDVDVTTGKKVDRWTSVKYEANKILGGMPQEGLNVYEVRYGGKARGLLEKAKETGNLELLGDVAQKYLHTSAGPEANDLLATYFLDRGQFFMAALRFERLLTLPDARLKNRNLVLLKAALAYRRAGDVKNFQKTWKRLEPQLIDDGGLKVGDQVVAMADLQKMFGDMPKIRATNPHDWALVRGNETNSAQASGSPPLLDEILWRRPTVKDKNEITGTQDEGVEAEQWIKEAVSKIHETKTIPAMPGFFPIAVRGMLIYRDYRGITAVNMHEVKDDKGDVLAKAGELEWKSTPFEGSLAVALSKSKTRDTLDGWLRNHYQGPAGFINLVYENSLVGTLSSDLTNVYAIDDLAVPLPPQLAGAFLNPNVNFGVNFNIPQGVKQMITENALHAYEIKTGKVLWRLEGHEHKSNKPIPELLESHFLGPPLPVGGKLYVLNEKNNGELRLLCIDPTKQGAILPPIQTLGTVDQQARFLLDPNRRIHAVHLAYGEGILICPTNAGEILGIDLLSRTLAWAYPYREKRQEQTTNPAPGPVFPPQPIAISLTPSTWKVAPPVISEGKVVFTAPDASSLHCLNLRDGTMWWKRKKNSSDLFLAGVWDGRVVVVGKNTCFALSLLDREQNTGSPKLLWSVTTGALPSGQGVASDNIYYLPLETGEVCAIDLERGTKKGYNAPSSPNAPKPGNLVFYEGTVLSQTPNEIVAYPQLSAKLDLVRADVKKNPDNLDKLTQLGELELANGQVKQAVQDLKLVMAKNPPDALRPRVRQKLYEALTDLFQADFKAASAQHLDEYKELLKVPDNPNEEQKRQGRFWQLMGSGYEAQGNLVMAYQAYREFSALRLYQQNDVPAVDDPQRKIPMKVWLRARIAGMFARAKTADRKPLEDKIAEEWHKVRDSKQIDAIRGFVAMFDAPFKVGREARLQLANAIIDRDDRGSFLEAELNLEQLRDGGATDSAAAGQALEALARLELRKATAPSTKMAAAYYRQLAEQFGTVIIRDGKTGKDLFNEKTADKRFLAELNPSGASWGPAEFKYRELDGSAIQVPVQGFTFQPEGDMARTAGHIRLVLEHPLNSSAATLHLVDAATNQKRWSQQMTFGGNNLQLYHLFNQQVLNLAENNPGHMPRGRFRLYQVKGHLAVVQIASEVYAIDLETPKILWQYTLMNAGTLQAQQIFPQQMTTDQDGNPELMVFNQLTRMRYRLRIGQVGTVQASYVALLKEDELVVLDPLTGKELWTRKEIPEDTVVFGDDEHLFLVEVNGKNASGGRVLRAADGTPVEVPDFSFLYQNRLHISGRRLLSSTQVNNQLVLRLYDIPTAKDLWKQTFAPAAVVLHSENRQFTGVIDPDAGRLIIYDLNSRAEVLNSSLLQYRITKNDLQDLYQPLLLVDDDHFYLALNRALDPREVSSGVLLNNFKGGLHCANVNGWFCAFHRRAGSARIDDKDITWKKGDLHWISSRPVTNQLVLLEQFENLPLILFSARYNTSGNNPTGNRAISHTQSIDKRDGKWVYSPLEARLTTGLAPQWHTFHVDRRDGAINMIGYNGILQHFIDDGRPRPKLQAATGQSAFPNGPISSPPSDRPQPLPGRGPGGGFVPVPGALPPPPGAPIKRRGAVNLPAQPPVAVPQQKLKLKVIERQGQVKIERAGQPVIIELPQAVVPPPPAVLPVHTK